MAEWRKLLDGKLESQARSAARRIARDLRVSISADELVGFEAQYPFSLGYGDAGVAVFFHYLAASYEDRSAGTNSRLLLERSVKACAIEDMPVSLFSGFSGIAWAVAHTQEEVAHCEESPDSFHLNYA